MRIYSNIYTSDKKSIDGNLWVFNSGSDNSDTILFNRRLIDRRMTASAKLMKSEGI
jgi:hypothetical protein